MSTQEIEKKQGREIQHDYPDIVSLYKFDLKNFNTLTESQEFWIGIALESDRFINKQLLGKNINNQTDCDLIYISLFNKIRQAIEKLRTISILEIHLETELLIELIKEALEFKQSFLSVKNSKLYEMNDLYIKSSYDLLITLFSYLWILPNPILDVYLNSIVNHKNLPSIATSLKILNKLDSTFEIALLRNLNFHAKNLLIERYLGYVRFYSYKYKNLGLDYADIIQEGNIGLLKAVERFDIRQRARFKTFSIWWIRQKITRAIADDSRTIRVPVHFHDKLSKLVHIIDIYDNDNFDEPSISTLVELSKYSLKDVISLINYLNMETQNNIYLLELCEDQLMENYLRIDQNLEFQFCNDCPFAMDEFSNIDEFPDNKKFIPFCQIQEFSGTSVINTDRANGLLKTLASDCINDLNQTLFNDSLNSALNSVLKTLPPRYSNVLKLRYGLHNGEPLTLDELGRKLGVTRERVRQIESQALSMLRQPNIKKQLREYL